jgi:hypothetical protein
LIQLEKGTERGEREEREERERRKREKKRRKKWNSLQYNAICDATQIKQ